MFSDGDFAFFANYLLNIAQSTKEEASAFS